MPTRKVKLMCNSVSKITSEPPAKPVPDVTAPQGWRKNGMLTTALLGATFALLANALIAVWSNYLTRRDQHVQEADKCNGVVETFISTTSFASEAAQTAASALAKPIPPGSSSKPFILPPIDEALHTQDQYLYIVDKTPVISLFSLRYTLGQSEMAYHTLMILRPRVTHFHCYPIRPTKKSTLTNCIVSRRRLPLPAESLDKSSSYCNDLAKTDWFSQPRPRPRAATRQ